MLCSQPLGFYEMIAEETTQAQVGVMGGKRMGGGIEKIY